MSATVQQNESSHQKFIETIDPDDPDYRKELQRPPDVKEDMRQMESRQRVSSILNSQAFREELESIIADHIKHGPHPASLIALQQISDLLLPTTNSRWKQVSSMNRTNNTEFDRTNGNVLIPINDIRGIDTLNYAKGERLFRCKLASLFRIIDLYGWTTGLTNQASLRLSPDLEQFLVNPHGLLYHEVTASSLLKVNYSGNIVEQGTSTYGINKIGFSLHSAIFKVRPDIRCVIHINTQLVTAISAMKCGLLPISQEAISCGNISYHEFKGMLEEEDVKNLLMNDLGPINKVMFLRNYGVVVCGESIEEACYYLFNVVAACETQSKALVAGLDNIIIPNVELQRKLSELKLAQNDSITLLENKKWKTGELEFEALMRCLDNAGYRTGYMYRQPIMRTIDRNAIKEVEIPPAVTSHNFDLEYIKKLKEEKQKLVKGEWLASPNNYARTEMEETGTPNPKKITKWVSENSPNKTSTPIRIENKNQFAPQGQDPRELKNHQKQIKQKYYKETIDAGPESKVISKYALDKAVKEGQLNGSGTESSAIVFGAVSKGIIKRDQQNNAVVYKSYYSTANPFQQMDPVELEKYKKEIAQKQIKDQVQRKDILHKELLGENGNEKLNKSEIITNESSKKKSNTIPRSKSLLDKKQEKPSDRVVSNSGGSHSSSAMSSRENSPSRNDKHNKTSDSKKNKDTDLNVSNKSATIPNASAKNNEKPEKPKKKSKLSFLSRKKNKDVSQ